MKVLNALLALGLIAAISPVVHQSSAQTATLRPTTPIAASAPTAVPALVPYSGALVAGDGRTFAAEAGITFQIYKDESGGEALWTETQTVAVDSTGHYKVQLGATNPNGLPADLFSTGEARWLEVQVAGQASQPRVLLASVPYALKASDATTLGGLPASAFALAGAKTSVAAAAIGGANVSPDITSNVTTTGGTSGYLPVFTGGTTVLDSILFQNSLGIGIGDVPNAALDVNGKAIFRGPFQVARIGNASPTSGVNSNPFTVFAQAYSTSTHGNVQPNFSLQSEPTGNNTASPGATLNLLYGNGQTTSSETGFYVNANGTFHFAPGQTFPGADIIGVVNASSYNLGGSSFATGSTSTGTAYIGFSGNGSSTGNDDTGLGFQSLKNNTSGFYNTALGSFALGNNTTGSYNTGIGVSAGPTAHALSNTTAVGANAKVSQSNSLVLGNTTTAPGAQFVNVGIGTATPASALEISVNAAGAVGPALTLTNSISKGGSNYTGNAAAINFYTYPVASSVQPGAQIEAVDNGANDPYFSLDNLVFSSEYPDGTFSFLQQNMIIYSGGQVVIGTNPDDSSSPNNALLTVLQPYPGGQDGINTIGASSVVPGNGISATGGLNTEPGASTVYGGTGGVFTGGDGDAGGIGGDGILAQTNPDTLQNSPGFAGVFEGDVSIVGTLFADTKDFKIDHPLDPANKYLVHASVESSEMMNIYSGNVTTDELGLATVTLPDWFQAENTGFRYQLTVVDERFAQAVVSKRIENNRFTIHTNASNVQVSWQITAVRQDAYAKAHPVVVEQQKPENEVGFYKHPELFGQPANKQTEWGRHPQMMQQWAAETNKIKANALNRAKKVNSSGDRLQGDRQSPVHN